MGRTVDYTPLLAAPPEAEVREFRRRARALGLPGTLLAPGTLVQVVVVLPLALIGGSIFFGAAATAILGRVDSALPAFVGALLVGAVAVVGIGAIIVLMGRRKRVRWAQLNRFALVNGLEFSPHSAAPSYPGSIFKIGSSRASIEHFRSADGRFLDFGNYQYTTGSGKNRRVQRWGFLALHIDRRLPHMVLDSRANNGLFGASNLPTTFDRSQRLRLEGDFDRHFTLYCPARYETDALYVFTPDLMALLIDEAAPFDVEIIDDWLFVYHPGGFESGSPAVYQRLLRIADTVGAKTLDQTERYRDERVADALAVNLVAPAGQRLRRGLPLPAIIGLVAVALVWILGIVPDLLGSLFSLRP